MAIKDKLTQEFLVSLKQIEPQLSDLHFYLFDIVQKGFAYFAYFKNESDKVEFIFGPPEFEIEMITRTPDKNYGFKDLLKIPAVATWVNENKYLPSSRRNISEEMNWFVQLLHVSLPLIESSKA